MTPEEATAWVDTAWSYGPFAFLFLAVAALYASGFGISKRRKPKDEPVERRGPVTIECPMNPHLESIKDALERLARQQDKVVEQNSRMLEKQTEANTHLNHLVVIHRKGDTGIHERVKREDVPGA